MMSDISFNGLGSFALFFVVSVFLGICIVLLVLRQYLLFSGSDRRKVRFNSLMIEALLFPFIASLLGLTALLVANYELKKLFDNYLSIAIVAFAILAGTIWLIRGIQKLQKQFS